MTAQPAKQKNEVIVDLNDMPPLQLHKTRAWKTADLKVVRRRLMELTTGVKQLFDRQPPDPAQQELIIRRICENVPIVLPHLVREIKRVDKRGATPEGIKITELAPFVEYIFAMIQSFRDRSKDSRAAMASIMERLAVPLVHFLDEISKTSELLWLHATWKRAVCMLLEPIFYAGSPAYAVLWPEFDTVCHMFVRLLDVFESGEKSNWETVLRTASNAIHAGASYNGLAAYIDALDPLMGTLLRSVMRMNFCPSPATLEQGAATFQSVYSWAFIRRANPSLEFFTVDHYAAFPFIMEWCFHDEFFARKPIVCLRILQFWLSCFRDVAKVDAELSAGDVNAVLRFTLSKLEQYSSRAELSAACVELLGIIVTTFRRDEEFRLLLATPVVRRLVETCATSDTREELPIWLFHLFTISDEFLSHYLAEGPSIAGQRLLDRALTFRRGYAGSPNGSEYNILLLHTIMSAIASIPNIDYANFRAASAGIVSSIYTLGVYRTDKTVRRTAFMLSCILHEGKPSKESDKLSESFLIIVADVDLLWWNDAHKPPEEEYRHIKHMGWKAPAIETRAIVLDFFLSFFFARKVSDECLGKVASWVHALACRPLAERRPTWSEMEMRAAYIGVLLFGPSSPHDAFGVGNARDFLRPCVALLAHNTDWGLNNTIVAEEYMILAWAAYCELCLPYDTGRSSSDLEIIYDYCLDIVQYGPKHESETISSDRLLTAAHTVVAFMNKHGLKF